MPTLVVVIPRGAVAALAVAALLAGCGEEGAAGPPPTAVRVSYDRDGHGGAPARTRRIVCEPADDRPACRQLRALPDTALEPVPARQACTQIYGGPQTGRIDGRIEGREVDARFKRTNGCEIARFAAAAPVLRLAL